MTNPKQASREESWSRLMTLAQAGDGRAYESLLRSLSAYIRPILQRRLNEASQIDDVSQEILLAIHRARHTYDCSRPFVPWLHAILRFRLTDTLRKIYKGKNFEELDLDRDYHETYSSPNPNEEVDATLLEALDRLPDKQTTVVKLLKLDGLSIKEVAAQTGMSESAIKVSAHRAYKAMRLLVEGARGTHER